jgi:hypothetical protein
MNRRLGRRKVLASIAGFGVSLTQLATKKASAAWQRCQPSQAPTTGCFLFKLSQTARSASIPVWTSIPKQLTPATQILIVMTGAQRDAQSCRDLWSPLSHELGTILLVPEFDHRHFPAAAYQQGNIVNAHGQPLPKAFWTLGIIENLFDYAKDLYSSQAAS